MRCNIIANNLFTPCCKHYSPACSRPAKTGGAAPPKRCVPSSLAAILTARFNTHFFARSRPILPRRGAIPVEGRVNNIARKGEQLLYVRVPELD